jgi:Cdc6-like AAA superfamily ATPase
MNADQYLWVEKYRPQTLSDCILTTELKSTFSQMIKSGELQNMMFVGNPGCGKTTVAKALCKDLGCDYILINCSEDGNIDTLRTKIRSFASTVSLTDSKKVVILDEFDYSNAQSIQPALRSLQPTADSSGHATGNIESLSLCTLVALKLISTAWEAMKVQSLPMKCTSVHARFLIQRRLSTMKDLFSNS